ncbi:MAG: PRC-barrel domain-containing protein [Roseomonas sp.]|jgi:photosynthetic reaction center H subunit|nr:PRC-barrel domain-containing protein [Roseomonas sp.]MCA3316920.1 PRC-barrel domain-containing protein [Roseomonas sp.]MCA3320836.1 PRC-barrel domain-containing protein [Roseomonas sp.]MCA3343861.1 PRC-barrel domain-containing protein [Roseomonas sp.]
MTTPATPVFLDLAAVSLYIFFAFFAGLVYYLIREGRREGFPLVAELPDRLGVATLHGSPEMPAPKVFRLHYPEGATIVQGVRPERDVDAQLSPDYPYPGTAFVPTGDAMQDGVGPAAYADRADTPDLAFDDNKPKIVPLRAAPGWHIAHEDPDPRGKSVITLDGVVAGTVVDLWVDRSEYILRYVETEIPGGRRVLVPMFLCTFTDEGTARVISVTAAQFAAAPGIARPEQITLLEEDRISGYFGGGHFYATPERSESYL